MHPNTQNILIVEDSPSLARTYEAQLASAGHQTKLAQSGKQAQELLSQEAFACILLDLKLPDIDGMALLKQWQAAHITSPVIVITAHGSVNVAVEAIKLGAIDFLMKPFDGQRLITTVTNILKQHELTSVVRTYRQKIDKNSLCSFIGASVPMQAVYRTLESAASSKATVFVTGESGTGKELAARAVHELSPRSKAPFIALNCGAIPKDLMESELFGHVRGAFTGATADRDGAACRANGGTLFLDEICEMDIALQSKLLRFIQLGSYQKVGDRMEREADIRFVAATNKDPLAHVRQGHFREDLYYRLHVIPVQMPPLRERGDDVLNLAQHFLEQHSDEEGKHFDGIDREAEELILAYGWPGNVRELENVIRNIVVLSDAGKITADMLKPLITGRGHCERDVCNPLQEHRHEAGPSMLNLNATNGPAFPADRITPLWRIEKLTIEHAIRTTSGNIQKAARMLEISPSTIYRKQEQWERRAQG